MAGMAVGGIAEGVGSAIQGVGQIVGSIVEGEANKQVAATQAQAQKYVSRQDLEGTRTQSLGGVIGTKIGRASKQDELLGRRALATGKRYDQAEIEELKDKRILRDLALEQFHKERAHEMKLRAWREKEQYENYQRRKKRYQEYQDLMWEKYMDRLRGSQRRDDLVRHHYRRDVGEDRYVQPRKIPRRNPFMQGMEDEYIEYDRRY